MARRKFKNVQIPRPVTVDFETFKIQHRPLYPPIPGGVSIKYHGEPAKYYAWAHLTGNNCTRTEARNALAKAWAHPDGVLFWNAKFDIDVAETHFGMPRLRWDKMHDGMFLLFLAHPDTRDLGLKSAAKEFLKIDPVEKEDVGDWLRRENPIPGIKIGKGANSKHPAGAYIAYAPGDLVGRYADGDVIRTEKFFEELYVDICFDRGMQEAYDRERKLMPILLDSERNGVRVDIKRLRADVAMYEGWLEKIDGWIITKLGAADLNISSGPQLTAALVKAGMADTALMGLTPGGKVATNKAALAAGLTNKIMGAVLQYRAQLRTCVNTFLKTWLGMANASGGYIYTTWNQTRGETGGTRTGRLSSSPNFQNIPKEFEPIFDHEKPKSKLPKSPWPNLPKLPLCRGYIIPYADGDVLIDRDYSQQEPRILAHFEDGELRAQYEANPWIDYHDNAKEHLEKIMGRKYERRPVKNINLGIIYGQGLASLAIKNNSTFEETKAIRDAIYKLYPGLKAKYAEMREKARNWGGVVDERGRGVFDRNGNPVQKKAEPIYTWGGREYWCEKPVKNKKTGRMQTFEYKMVNTQVQGSAADCTKEAIIRFADVQAPKWRMLIQVHDSILISAPKRDLKLAMATLRDQMESVEFKVPILSEGDWSETNWADLKKYDRKGKIL